MLRLCQCEVKIRLLRTLSGLDDIDSHLYNYFSNLSCYFVCLRCIFCLKGKANGFYIFNVIKFLFIKVFLFLFNYGLFGFLGLNLRLFLCFYSDFVYLY